LTASTTFGVHTATEANLITVTGGSKIYLPLVVRSAP
jgi:hypothetical protein